MGLPPLAWRRGRGWVGACILGAGERDVGCRSSAAALVCLSLSHVNLNAGENNPQMERGGRAELAGCAELGSEPKEHVLRLVFLPVTRPLALPQEHRSLLLKMKEGEAELARLRSVEGDKLAEQDR